MNTPETNENRISQRRHRKSPQKNGRFKNHVANFEPRDSPKENPQWVS